MHTEENEQPKSQTPAGGRKQTVTIMALAALGVFSALGIIWFAGNDFFRSLEEPAIPPPLTMAQASCDGAPSQYPQDDARLWDKDHVNDAVQNVRDHRPDCATQGWNPQAMNAADRDMCGQFPTLMPGHIGGGVPPKPLQSSQASGIFTMPGGGAMTIDEYDGAVSKYTRREATGDILIHFQTSPGDGSNCWMFDSARGYWRSE